MAFTQRWKLAHNKKIEVLLSTNIKGPYSSIPSRNSGASILTHEQRPTKKLYKALRDLSEGKPLPAGYGYKNKWFISALTRVNSVSLSNVKMENYVGWDGEASVSEYKQSIEPFWHGEKLWRQCSDDTWIDETLRIAYYISQFTRQRRKL